jgi:hypothetical protein
VTGNALAATPAKPLPPRLAYNGNISNPPTGLGSPTLHPKFEAGHPGYNASFRKSLFFDRRGL